MMPASNQYCQKSKPRCRSQCSKSTPASSLVSDIDLGSDSALNWGLSTHTPYPTLPTSILWTEAGTALWAAAWLIQQRPTVGSCDHEKLLAEDNILLRPLLLPPADLSLDGAGPTLKAQGGTLSLPSHNNNQKRTPGPVRCRKLQTSREAAWNTTHSKRLSITSR